MKLWDKKTPLAVFLATIALLTAWSVYNNTSKDNPAQLNLSPSTQTSNLSITYSGKLPCADCEGIEEELTLIKDSPEATGGSYLIKDTYLGKDTKPFEETGKWVLTKGSFKNPSATIYVLDPEKVDETKYFLDIDEDSIKQLDRNKKEIDSPFNQTLIKK